MLSLMRATSVTAVVAGVLALVAGCDSADIDALVNDAKNQISEVTETAPDEPGPVGSDEIVAQPTPPAAAAIPPEELVRNLLSTKPNNITGAMLKAAADVPEAAGQIYELDLTGAKLTDTEFVSVGAFSNLQTLNLSNVDGPSAIGLAVVGKLSGLTSLSLRHTPADDGVLAAMNELTHLRSLDLENSQITGAGLGHLKSHGELQELNLQATRIDDGSLAALPSIPVQTLNVSKTSIGNPGLAEIANIPTLQSLDISQSRVTGAGFQILAKSNLKSLNASSTNFGTEGLVAIRGMKSLEELILFRASIIQSDRANVFRTFPKLRSLNLGSNAISDQGVNVLLKGLKNLERLELAAIPDLTTNSLEVLRSCKKLEYLDMTDTHVTSSAMAKFKELLRKPEMVTLP